jgi:hypothetical protein
MSDDIYPGNLRGIAFSVKRAPEFSTIIHGSSNFIETRIRQAANPRWHYDLKYNLLRDDPNNLIYGESYTDFKLLLGFFLDHSGQYDTFLFEDTQTPDNYVGPAIVGPNPNLDAQLPLIQDTDTGIWYSPLQRRIGSSWVEDIADLKGTPAIYDNAVLKTPVTEYTIGGPGLAVPGYSYAGKYVQWTGTPSGPVTAAFYFYWRVRFEVDQMDLEKFSYQRWAAGGDKGGSSVKFMTQREYAA